MNSIVSEVVTTIKQDNNHTSSFTYTSVADNGGKEAEVSCSKILWQFQSEGGEIEPPAYQSAISVCTI